MSVQLFEGDCLDVMKQIQDASIDLVLCDLPYGTTACKWDSIIPLENLWAAYRLIGKETTPFVLTASQPFTTKLIASNYKDFRYCWVWDKVNKYTGALNVNRMPLKRHEDIAVFYRALPTYNKQFREGKAFKGFGTKGHGAHTQYGTIDEHRAFSNDGKHHNPCSVLEVPADNKLELGLHPTQKPIALMEYLIKTYSNPGDTVLDNCMGSGTTGVACVSTGRNFIGIEKDPGYFGIAKDRIEKAQRPSEPSFF